MDGLWSQMSTCSILAPLLCVPGQVTETFSALMTSSIKVGTVTLVENFISLRRFKHLLPRAHPNKEFNKYAEVLLVVTLLLCC